MGVLVAGQIHIGTEDEAVRPEVHGALEAAGIAYASVWCGRSGCVPALHTVTLIGDSGRVEGVSSRSFAEAAKKAAGHASEAGW